MGANLGDREANLAFGRDELARRGGIRWTLLSPIFETEPVGPVAGQNSYLNQVGIGETEWSAQALLNLCLSVEAARGRERSVRWGPRTLDLDVLLFGDQRIDTPSLRIPHPEMTGRAFVLVPLAEIAPTWVIPGTGKTVQEVMSELMSSVTGRNGVRRWRSSAT